MLSQIENNLESNISDSLENRIDISGFLDERDDSYETQNSSNLKMAGAIQRDFLPSKLPCINGIEFSTLFMPADCVSGDIYDINRLDEDHIGFYIADAVGRSMPAALLTIFIQQAIQMRETTENSYRIFEPAEVLSRLNNKMAEQQLSGCLFATMVYCLLNTKTLELSFARGGHPYPIVIKNGGDLKVCESRGSLLGVFDSSLFTTQKIQLKPGDKVFIHSDGLECIIGEYDSSSNFKPSEDFLAASELSASDMTAELKEIAKIKTYYDKQKDDMTAVVLEVPKS